MSPEHLPHSSARGTFLTVLLLGLLGLGGFVFFLGLMGPFAIAFVVIVAVITVGGLFHYLLWGRSFSQEISSEQEQAEPPDREIDGPHYPGRF